MPPKKKPRLSRLASSPSIEPLRGRNLSAPSKGSPVKDNHALRALSPDAWTDEEEICLFKGMIRWKPVGLHKHFRMIALSQHLRNHGHQEPHTSISGIWAKLGKLYNLKALDEREDAFAEVQSDESEPMEEKYLPYELPPDFDDLMDERRFNPAGTSSPPLLAYQDFKHAVIARGSTIETDDLPNSPAPSQSAKRTRGAKAKGRSRLADEVTSRRGRASNVTKETSVEADDDDEKDEEPEEEEDSEQGSTKKKRGSTKSKRGGRLSIRGRGRRGRRA